MTVKHTLKTNMQLYVEKQNLIQVHTHTHTHLYIDNGTAAQLCPGDLHPWSSAENLIYWSAAAAGFALPREGFRYSQRNLNWDLGVLDCWGRVRRFSLWAKSTEHQFTHYPAHREVPSVAFWERSKSFCSLYFVVVVELHTWSTS